MAILFGSKLGTFENETFSYYSKILTYSSFLIFGIIGFLPKKNNISSKKDDDSKSSFITKILSIKINYVLIIAISIIVGEIGDKTFLASLGLGLEYPHYKVSLILGSILGMVMSNSIALFFGKILGNKLKPSFIELLSNLIFIVFGIIGFVNIFSSRF